MPSYSFVVTDGQETLPGPSTLDLPGPAAAREEAVLLARSLKQGGLAGDRDWGGWFVAVKDARGQQVEAVPIADVED